MLLEADARGRASRKMGKMRGRARVTRAFFDALPEHELKRWE